jgi:hypothetical protein
MRPSAADEVSALGHSAKNFIVALARQALLEFVSDLIFEVDGGAVSELNAGFENIVSEAWPDLIGEAAACHLLWHDPMGEKLTTITVTALDHEGRSLLRQQYSAAEIAVGSKLPA